jgi:hypothetical protein
LKSVKKLNAHTVPGLGNENPDQTKLELNTKDASKTEKNYMKGISGTAHKLGCPHPPANDEKSRGNLLSLSPTLNNDRRRNNSIVSRSLNVRNSIKSTQFGN